MIIARVLMGLIFVFFGLNGFLQFLKAPKPTGLAGEFLTVLFQSHYVLFICVVHVVGGLLLLVNRYVPLAFDVAGARGCEYHFVPPAFESYRGVFGGGGDRLLVLFVLSLSAELFRIIGAKGVSASELRRKYAAISFRHFSRLRLPAKHYLLLATRPSRVRRVIACRAISAARVLQ